jgi:hemolysin activation/secretion protein
MLKAIPWAPTVTSTSALVALAFFGAGAASAQTVPDAGSLLQRIEADRQTQLPAKSAPQFLPPPAMQAMQGATVEVKAFKFAGNTLLSAAQLEPVLAGFLNRPIDFNTLKNTAVEVAAAYRKAGWIVRVYLPQQDIQGGVVTIQIVEAVFGALRFEGNATRVSQDQIKSIVTTAQPVGAALNSTALDRALLLIDDLPGISTNGRLTEGQNQAETDLTLAVTDSPRFTGDVGVDNTGSRSTGESRLTASLAANSPAGRGDQATANLIHTEGSDYLRAAYSMPVGNDGWRVGLNASHLSYEVLTLGQANGSSTTTGVDARYPLVRSRLRNVFVQASYDAKSFDNRSAGVVATQYKTQALSLSLNGNLFDNWQGGGSNNASLTLVSGKVDLAGSPNEAADAASTQTAGSFHKWRYALSRQQVLSDITSVYAALSGQIAGKNLDSSEKFYLGGANGVRAYPSSEGGGSEGQMLNLEVRARLPSNVNLTGFYDIGSVTVNQNNAITGAAPLNNFSLKGVGVSVGWTSSFGLSLKATLARRLGDNPNANAGNDQDGSLVQNRLWLQATLAL